MLESLKIQRRQSEIRQQLAELVGKDKPTDDETRSMGELDGEYRSNETRYRAALIAEDEERQEAKGELETRSDREWSDMIDQFEMRQVAGHSTHVRSAKRSIALASFSSPSTRYRPSMDRTWKAFLLPGSGAVMRSNKPKMTCER